MPRVKGTVSDSETLETVVCGEVSKYVLVLVVLIANKTDFSQYTT